MVRLSTLVSSGRDQADLSFVLQGRDLVGAFYWQICVLDRVLVLNEKGRSSLKRQPFSLGILSFNEHIKKEVEPALYPYHFFFCQ